MSVDQWSQGPEIFLLGVLGTFPPQITLRLETQAQQGFQKVLTFYPKSGFGALYNQKSTTYGNIVDSSGNARKSTCMPTTPSRLPRSVRVATSGSTTAAGPTAVLTGKPQISFASRGKIGPIGIKAFVGWTYNMPMNLDSAKNIGFGGYMNMFFTNMFTQVSEEESARLLQFRSRNQIIGDLELSYKKLSIGGAVFYGSFPEYLPGTVVQAINLISSTVEGEEAMTVYAREQDKGDLIFDARIAYQVFKFMKASFIVKNVANKLYAIRPGKAEPVRNFTVQLQFNL